MSTAPRRIARHLRRSVKQWRVSGRSHSVPGPPFAVKQVACPDGRTLTVSVKHHQPVTSTTKLRLGAANLIDPSETIGNIDRFVVDLPSVLPASGTHPIRLIVDGSEYRLPALPRDDSVAMEGPVTRGRGWYRVSPGKDGASITAVTTPHAVVVRAIRSTVDGIVCVLDEAEGAGRLLLKNRSGTRSVDLSEGAEGWTVPLLGLRSPESDDPEYWEFVFEKDGKQTAVVADSGDLTRYGAAVNIPTLVSRNATTGTDIYAKVYFTVNSRLAVRTGLWREVRASA